MTSAAGRGVSDYGDRLEFTRGQLVLEIGEDDDVDDDVRSSIEQVIGRTLLDEDHEGEVDVVLFWFRLGDGDLADLLMDALGRLADGGRVLLLTPNPGKPGHVDTDEIVGAAPSAGGLAAGTIAAGAWTATRLVRPTAPDARG
ncbi:DUF3052 family protein [Streptomyces lateritius]|uniref:DUF3052 family protein n=1 Tax=Streptomyces lateritius TaxID=67313 RepID=UPI001C8C6EA3|nr:DUF3052 family protein [Streptomyces lateritius]MBX9426814.1 DUF3052 domain-containing protein [Streptomyces lateritius]